MEKRFSKFLSITADIRFVKGCVMGGKRIIVTGLLLALVHVSLHACPYVNDIRIIPPMVCVNKAVTASAQVGPDYGWGDADYDRKWRWIVTDPNDNKVYIPDKNGKASSTVEPIKISGETFGAGELTPGEYTVRLELSGKNEESGREYDWGYAYHEEKFLAVKADLDVDSNNNDKIEEIDDPIEAGFPSKIICVNEDDDDDDEKPDNSDKQINGSIDKEDMSELVLRLDPDNLPEDHKVELNVVENSKIRMFDDSEKVIIGPQAGQKWEKSLGEIGLPGEDLTFYIEGIQPGKNILIQMIYKSNDGRKICEDIVAVTVMKVYLDISRLDLTTVEQTVEASEGSITKILYPEDENNTQKRKEYLLRIPTFTIKPIEVFDYITLKLEKVGPPASAGKIRVFKDADLSSAYMGVDQKTKIVKKDDLDKRYDVEAVKCGVVDLALAAYSKSSEKRICKDRIRVSCIITKPKNGYIILVNKNDEFDLTADESGHGKYEAEDSIKDGLGEAGKQDNVCIGRGTFYESSLVAPDNILIVGFGGEFSGPLPGNDYSGLRPDYKYDNLPVVNGNKTGPIFLFQGNGSEKTELAALKVTNGRSSSAPCISIENTNDITIGWNNITENYTIPVTRGYGGGIFIENNKGVNISENAVTNNRVGIGGGGVYVKDSSSIIILHNDIMDNFAFRYGGGIGCRGTQGNPDVSINNNSIYTNKTQWFGGGICICGLNDDVDALRAAGPLGGWRGSRVGIPCIVKKNEIQFNEVLFEDIEPRGGGVYNGAFRSSLSLVENSIQNNTTYGDGAGVSILNMARVVAENNNIYFNGSEDGDDGGGINQWTFSSGIWRNNRIIGNQSGNNGGGMHITTRSNVTSEGNLFQLNTTKGNERGGGGLYIRNSSFTSNGNNIFTQNTSNKHGGGIYIHSQYTQLFAASDSRISLTNGDKIEFNSATKHGGGLFCQGSTYFQTFVKIEQIVCDSNSANSTVAGIKTSGAYFEYTGDLLYVQYSRFTGHNGAGITFEDYNDINPSVVRNNVFESNFAGIVSKKAWNSVRNNTFTGNRGYHLFIEDLSSAFKTRIISNNFVWGQQTISAIRVSGSLDHKSLLIHRNNFVGHNIDRNSYAIFISEKISKFIDAENNWWNSPNGPHDPSPPGTDGDYNANPSGDRVWDYVDYKPYAKSAF